MPWGCVIDVLTQLTKFCAMSFAMVCLGAASLDAKASSYEKLAEDSSSSLYIEKGSLDRSGKSGVQYPMATILLNFTIPLNSKHGVSRSAVMYVFFDCKQRRQVVTASTYYSSPMGRGSVVFQDGQPDNQPISAPLYQRVCIQ